MKRMRISSAETLLLGGFLFCADEEDDEDEDEGEGRDPRKESAVMAAAWARVRRSVLGRGDG
jgi:hypothetical protein